MRKIDAAEACWWVTLMSVLATIGVCDCVDVLMPIVVHYEFYFTRHLVVLIEQFVLSCRGHEKSPVT